MHEVPRPTSGTMVGLNFFLVCIGSQTLRLRFYSGARRLYGKDAPCPVQWGEWLSPEAVPARTLPFSVDDIFWHMEPDVSHIVASSSSHPYD